MFLRVATVLFPAVLLSQPIPTFDVASVKVRLHPRSPDGYSHSSIDTPSPGYFVAENAGLPGLIEYAYNLKGYQISGPNWLNDEAYSFDVNARAVPGSMSTKTQIRMMVQALLKERFHLAVHFESKVVPGFALEIDPHGIKMKSTKQPTERAGINAIGGDVTAVNVSMGWFADILAGYLKSPVYDRTGLPGNFDFKLHYDSSESGSGPSVFAALEEQLGLRLRASREPIQILVVDHAEKAPTEN